MELRSGKLTKSYGATPTKTSGAKETPKKDAGPVLSTSSRGPVRGQVSNDASSAPHSWVVDIRIGTCTNGAMYWEPVRVQMEVDQQKEARWREHIAKSFAVNVLVKPFLWSSQGVILLDVKVDNIPAKAVYNHGCAGVAGSQ